MYKNLFFDFDGTLFNGYPRMLNAMIRMFKEKRNFDITYEELFKDAMVSFGHINKKYELSKEEWDYYYSIVYSDDTSVPPFMVFDGVEDLLKTLTERGVNCFIYTNRNEDTIKFMKDFGLDVYIKDYICNALKPSIGPLDNMIEKYNLTKEECMVVGDRELDIDGAIASSIDSFSINDYKPEPKATYQGQSFDDLLKIVFMEEIKAVIFDMDGVLISTDELHNIAWKRIADEEGIYFDENIGNELRGISRKSSLEVILRQAKREYTYEEKQELLNRKGLYYTEILDGLTQDFIPQVTRNCLKTLNENGIRVSIGSSSLNGKYITNRLDFAKEFEVIVDGTMIDKPKPNPEVFLKAAEAMNLRPSQCVIVEDATAGIEAANRGGFISIGMSFAKLFNKTNIRIDSLDELYDVIKRINSIAK